MRAEVMSAEKLRMKPVKLFTFDHPFLLRITSSAKILSVLDCIPLVRVQRLGKP